MEGTERLGLRTPKSHAPHMLGIRPGSEAQHGLLGGGFKHVLFSTLFLWR